MPSAASTLLFSRVSGPFSRWVAVNVHAANHCGRNWRSGTGGVHARKKKLRVQLIPETGNPFTRVAAGASMALFAGRLHDAREVAHGSEQIQNRCYWASSRLSSPSMPATQKLGSSRPKSSPSEM